MPVWTDVAQMRAHGSTPRMVYVAIDKRFANDTYQKLAHEHRLYDCIAHADQSRSKHDRASEP